MLTAWLTGTRRAPVRGPPTPDRSARTSTPRLHVDPHGGCVAAAPAWRHPSRTEEGTGPLHQEAAWGRGARSTDGDRHAHTHRGPRWPPPWEERPDPKGWALHVSPPPRRSGKRAPAAQGCGSHGAVGMRFWVGPSSVLSLAKGVTGR